MYYSKFSIVNINIVILFNSEGIVFILTIFKMQSTVDYECL